MIHIIDPPLNPPLPGGPGWGPLPHLSGQQQGDWKLIF